MEKRYAVVTGASSGIGSEFVKYLAGMGYTVIMVARRRERLMKLAGELHSKKHESIVLTADLSIQEECEKLLQEIEDKHISVFINNAGFGDCGSFLQTSEVKELHMIDVNIKALHFLTKRMILKMEQQKEGYILNVASSAGLLPGGPYMATYYATKAYVASLTLAVAEELKEKNSNIYIGALCPGPVNTEFNDVANVKLALPGISPKYCAQYALRKMKQKKVIIVPTLAIKAVIFGNRLISRKLGVKLAGHQQKKKITKWLIC